MVPVPLVGLCDQPAASQIVEAAGPPRRPRSRAHLRQTTWSVVVAPQRFFCQHYLVQRIQCSKDAFGVIGREEGLHLRV